MHIRTSCRYATPESKDWQDDFDGEYCGTQIVTIRYRDKETTIRIISENSFCEKCGEKCNDRCYEDYVKYPYCLECLSGMYVYCGQSKEEEQIVMEKELLYELDTDGEFLLNRGDFVMVTYKQGKNVTILQRNIKINGRSGKNK